MNIDEIEVKEDSTAKLNAVQGLPTKNVLFATEFNAVVKAVKNARIIPVGQLSIFKLPPNQDNSTLEIGDFVQGFVEGQFISADYLGGNALSLSSYSALEMPPPPPPGDGLTEIV